MELNSEPKQLALTDAQRFSDQSFLESVRSDFICPLVAEFEEQIEGFSEMQWSHRVAYVLKLNEPLTGIGDYLPLHGSLVYAGKLLGKRTRYMLDGVFFEQYQPRFWGENDGFYTFMDEDYPIIGSLHYFLKNERPEYEALPSPYKAALLCRLIRQKVIAADETSILKFVIGASETLETYRYSVVPTNYAGKPCGWTIRISGLKPDKGFWEQLRLVLCNHGHLPAAKARKPRKPDPKTELACTYIYELEQKGVIIDSRKGGVGYARIMVDMKEKFGDKVRDYEPDNLGRIYRQWKKKNDMQ